MKFPSLLTVILTLASCCSGTATAHAHGTLVNGRMYNVRIGGSAGGTPAGWNESYYTWNQDSNTFPNYAAAGFSYAAYVPDNTLASAGINNGANGHLDFTGLNTPSANWATSAATAGAPFTLHWVASAAHDPSYFEVFITKPSFDPTTMTLGWGDLVDLGKWSLGDSAHPVTNGMGPSPQGGTLLSYDWSIPVPATASGRETLVVVWQRMDPAGEAFFAVQDLQVTPVPEPALASLLLPGVAALGIGRRGHRTRVS